MKARRSVRRRVLCAFVVGGISLLAVPAVAGAGTVLVRHESDRDGTPSIPVVSYRAAVGERNDVVLAFNEEERLVIVRDTGVPVTAGVGCISIDASTARCSAPATPFPHPRVRVDLDDLNDTLLSQPGSGPDGRPGSNFLWLIASGGAGDDVLDASHAVAADLDGGGGVDRLFGSQGNDLLTDGDRDDAAGGDAPNQDLIDGGPGDDHLSYARRSAPVVVDLADNQPEGKPGEGDIVSDVEGVTGGSGNDRLAGNDRGNILDGGHGRDTLIGRGGDDSFGWTYAREAAFDDRWPIRVGSPAFGDAVVCGPGQVDRVWGRRARDFVEPACEWIDALRRLPFKQSTGSYFSRWTLPAYPVQIRSSLTYSVYCAGDEFRPQFRCSGSVRFREASGRKRLLARGTFPRDSNVVDARLHLTTLGHRLASRPRGVRALLRVRGQNLPTAAWTIRLKIR